MKKITNLLFLGLALISSCCKKDTSPTPASPPELISIRSTLYPSGNSLNIYDLQISPINALESYSLQRTGDTISQQYLGQATMSSQTSAWDKVNKRYWFYNGFSLLEYNYSSGSPAAPIERDTLSQYRFIGSTGGTMYTVTQSSELKYFDYSSGLFHVCTGNYTLPSLANVYISNMTNDASGNLYFIAAGKLTKCAVAAGACSAVTTASALSDTAYYDAVQYNITDNKIYAIKRTSYRDDLVRIDPILASETIVRGSIGLDAPPSAGANLYTRDYSRISSALNPGTDTYYLICSNPFSYPAESHIAITISNISTSTPTYTSSIGNKYVFGLHLKD